MIFIKPSHKLTRENESWGYARKRWGIADSVDECLFNE